MSKRHEIVSLKGELQVNNISSIFGLLLFYNREDEYSNDVAGLAQFRVLDPSK